MGMKIQLLLIGVLALMLAFTVGFVCIFVGDLLSGRLHGLNARPPFQGNEACQQPLGNETYSRRRPATPTTSPRFAFWAAFACAAASAVLAAAFMLYERREERKYVHKPLVGICEPALAWPISL